MSVEDRLRAVGQAAAATVRDVPPLDLPELPEPAPRRPLRPPSGRWRPWLVPLAAAASVIAVAATLVAVRNTSDRPSGVPAAPEAAAAVPRYYVALNVPSVTMPVPLPVVMTTVPADVVVGDTRTGGRLATVSPPAGYTFTAVTGAADDRTFVLEARRFPWSPIGDLELAPRAFYLLRLAPGTARAARLTKLPVPATASGTLVEGIALSPDGGKLAVMFQSAARTAHPGPVTLRIYSVPAGRLLDSWTGPEVNGPWVGSWIETQDSNSSLFWIDGGRELTFFYGTKPSLTGIDPAPGTTIRALDLARPGHDLLADSRVILVLRSLPQAGCATMLVTADGQAVICGTESLYGRNALVPGPGFAEYSTVTGRLSGYLYQHAGSVSGGSAFVLWASPSGDTLAGSTETVVYGSKPHGEVDLGVFTQGRFRPLRIQLATSTRSLVEITF